MRESRLSGSVEGVVCKHDSYSDFAIRFETTQALVKLERLEHQLSDDLHFATIQPYFEESS
jgi:hypothetical protein